MLSSGVGTAPVGMAIAGPKCFMLSSGVGTAPVGMAIAGPKCLNAQQWRKNRPGWYGHCGTEMLQVLSI